MARVIFEKKEYQAKDNESVLDCLLRNGLKMQYGCKNGLCQACLLRCKAGKISENSQQSLKENQQKTGIFKPCVCPIEESIEVELINSATEFKTKVLSKEFLSHKIIRLRLSVPSEFSYRAGQFINLVRPHDCLTRSYSLASTMKDSFLELHIRLYPDGKMSQWLVNEVQIDDELILAGPLGECFYTYNEEKINQPLLLAGIGTGMAPLYGILRDALDHGHLGQISVIQGAMSSDGLYYNDEFSQIADNFPQVKYMNSTVDGSGGNFAGKIDDVVRLNFSNLKNYRVYLCGSPNTVNRLKRYSFLAGANMKEIYSDPFVVAAT